MQRRTTDADLSCLADGGSDIVMAEEEGVRWDPCVRV